MQPDEKSQLMDEQIQVLRGRFTKGVGFVNSTGLFPRADAACWAILGLQAAEREDELVNNGREQLARAQSTDGRVCVTGKQKDAYWPTSLAILAWHGEPKYKSRQDKAAQFLLAFNEFRTAEDRDKIFGHDTTIKGWPWITDTSPWVEPTAYALMGLRVTGFLDHERTREGIDLLMDRQLPHGGWNYGNTTVFGHELRPMPETTGVSLQALSGLVSRNKVEKSISYCRSQLASLRTPLALAWILLGLGAWGEPIEERTEYIFAVLRRQEKYGPYDTASLGMILTAWCCEKGLLKQLSDKARFVGLGDKL